MIRLTHHAQDRARQRLRKPSAAAMRAATRAFVHGLRVEETRGKLHNALVRRIERHGKGHDARVWDGAIWIFEGTTLITVYRVPPYLREQAEKQMRRAR